MTQAPIYIRPAAKRNGVFYAFCGCCLLFVTLILADNYWLAIKLQLILLLLVSLLLIFFGILKIREPHASFELSPNNLVHIHQYGRWQITWPNIKRAAQPKLTHGVEQIELPYIGIQLNDFTKIATQISPRLANRLLHEQREIIMLCFQLNLVNFEQIHIDFNPYIVDGRVFKGPVAAWLHRTSLLNDLTGFHLFIAKTSIDRPVDEFISLLYQCKHASNAYSK